MPHRTPNNQIKRSYSESTEEAGSQSGGSNGRLLNLEKRWGRTRGPIKVSFQAREVFCVRTNGRQMFVPVSFKHFAGEDCALINSGGKVTWLARVLHRQQRDEYDTSLVVRAFDAKIRERLKQLAEQASVAPHDHEQQSATLAQGSRKQNVMSDSENSDGSPDSGETTAAPQARRQPCGGQKKRKRKLGCAMGYTIDVLGWTAVDLGEGVSLKLAAARNQPGLITPLRVQNITDVLHYLDKSYSQLLAAGRGLQAEQQGQLDAMGAPAPSEVGAPVRYNIQHESYLIVYQDSSGKIAKTGKGLHCPRVKNGVYVSPEAYAALKKHKLALARTMWNAMDHSGAPRLDMPDPD